MNELYALGVFNQRGEFLRYVRKGRNNAVSGYDNLAAARRGLSHSRSRGYETRTGEKIRIVRAATLEVVYTEGDAN